MAVTPKGIVTPDASSPYNLVTDLSTLASTADAAIVTQKGTASQRAAALAGAPEGTLWQDTDGIKMIWRKDGAAWVPAVWAWGGSVPQMNSFTQAPDGFEWTDPSSRVVYIRSSGAWIGANWTNLTPVDGTPMSAPETPMVRISRGLMSFKGGCTNAGVTASTSRTMLQIPSSVSGLSFPWSGFAASSIGAAGALWIVAASGSMQLRPTSTVGSYYKIDSIAPIPLV